MRLVRIVCTFQFTFYARHLLRNVIGCTLQYCPISTTTQRSAHGRSVELTYRTLPLRAGATVARSDTSVLYPRRGWGRDGVTGKVTHHSHPLDKYSGAYVRFRADVTRRSPRSPRTERARDYRKRRTASPSRRFGRATGSGHAPNAAVTRSG